MLWALIILIIGLAITLFVLISPLGDGGVHRPSQVALTMLLETELVEQGEARLFGGGGLERRDRLYILRLSGSAYEMGFQQGRLLRDEIRQGAVPYFDRAVDHIAPFDTMSAPLRWLAGRYLDWAIFLPLMKNSPEAFLQELKGLADGCGLPFPTVLRGNLFSELNMCLGKTLARRYAGRLFGGECTSFAAFGAMTQGGELIVGRNTDYWGVGLWDCYPTLVFYQPEQGQRFVNVSSAGLLKCNACLNETGLFLGGHFMLSDDVNPRGIGFTAFELEIMKKAASIDEAYRLLLENPRAGAFAFLIADGKSQDAAVIEACASAVGLRFAQGECIWETNFATTDEFRPHEVFARLGASKNSEARYERMRQLLQENQGKIDAQTAADCMGDHLDVCSDDLRPSGHIIGTLSNVTSAVFKPASFDFWVASGLAPAANNVYLGSNFKDELEGRTGSPDPQRLNPNPYAQTPAFATLRRYYEVSTALSISPVDIEHGGQILQEVVDADPEQAAYRLVAGRLALKRQDFAVAQDHLGKALRLKISSSERAQAHLLLGFTYDLLGQRDQALHCYQQVIKLGETGASDILRSINPFAMADAYRFSQRPYNRQDLDGLEVSPNMVGEYDR
jgi:isopenicillin-N N-acyltransferase-like protein